MTKQRKDPSPLVLQLLRAQNESHDRGERIPLVSLLREFPQVAADQDELLQLIENDIRLRLLRGDSVDSGEYEQMFPELAADVAHLSQHALTAGHDQADLGTATLPGDVDTPEDKVPSETVATIDLSTQGGRTVSDTPGQAEATDQGIDQTIALTPGQDQDTAGDPYDTMPFDGETDVDDLGKTPFSGSVAGAPPPPAGRTTGAPRYQIVRPHARGGLGQVSLANDLELNRPVALKEILPQYAQHQESQVRFIAEAEITGGLEHPGIVPVYGLGYYADGRPYYAMRFIRGESMKDAAQQLHEASEDSPAVDTVPFRRLLRHFLDMCNAIHYAHTRGVIHRDLKPDNVMLGHFGETLVVDWGLAKPTGEVTDEVPREKPLVPVLSGHSVSLAGSTVGTPGYMSPEQADAQDITTSSDVYSLGATLYYLLTGRPPIYERNPWVAIDKAKKSDFEPPIALNPRTPKPLNAICLKAMAAKPGERYRTAVCLADDIECWLADEPVVAYQEGFREIARRWARKHRAWVQAGAALFLAVTCVSLVAAVLIGQAWHQETLARESSERNRARAIARYGQAREAVSTWLTSAGESLRFYPGAAIARERLLRRAADDLSQLASVATSDRDLELERVNTFLLQGDVYLSLFDYKHGLTAYDAALQLVQSLGEPSLLTRRLEAKAGFGRGLALAGIGHAAESEESFSKALEQLSEMVAETEGDEQTAVCQDLLSATVGLTELLQRQGQVERADSLLSQAIEKSQDLVSLGSEREGGIVALCEAILLRAGLRQQLGRSAESMADLTSAAGRIEPLVARAPDNPEFAEVHAAVAVFKAGLLRDDLDRIGEAEAYEQAIEDYSALLEAMPDVPRFRQFVALTRIDLGQTLFQRGLTASASDQLNLAITETERLRIQYPDNDTHLEQWATAQDLLGQTLTYLGQWDQANHALQQAAAAFESLAQSHSESLIYQERGALAYAHLAHATHLRGSDPKGAAAAFELATQILQQLADAYPEIPRYREELAVTLQRYAWLHLATGEEEKAAGVLRQASDLWSGLVAGQQPAAFYRARYAEFLVRSRLESLHDAETGLSIAASLAAEHQQNAAVQELHAFCLLAAERAEEAVAVAQAARKLPDGEHARLAFTLAAGQLKLGRTDEAKDSLARGVGWMQLHRPADPSLQRASRALEARMSK